MNLERLSTEQQNEASLNIDRVSTIEMIKIINDEDKKVALAVEKEIENIAKAVDAITEKFMAGGRLIYCGAGTSGRMGALDAIELTPTYSVDPSRAFGILAGGKEAMFLPIEGAEDSKELAVNELKEINFSKDDVLIAIAASGRTPYTIGAIEYANSLGALSISVTCNKNSEMNNIASIGIAPIVGPEVITGSTRMKAGTAQKMVLNMLSTGVMIKSGKVYHNLMVHVQATNEKLVYRSIKIIQTATGADNATATDFFEKSGRDVSLAIVMIETKLTKEEAKTLLEENLGNVSEAIRKTIV